MKDIVADMRARRALSLARSPGLMVPLDVPTADGVLSVTHPTLVYSPEGWNGYKYHLFYTPYPGDPREDITYAVSNDLAEWVSPMGSDPRIYTLAQAQALGASYNSDPHALLIDGVMHVYHRPAGAGERIVLSTSANGTDWTHQTLIDAATDADILSPAVVRVDATTWHMFSVKEGGNPTARIVERRDSSDGLTWGAPQAVTIPTGINPWHLDVQYAAGKFHMLIDGSPSPEVGGAVLYYATSADGATFTGTGKRAVTATNYGPDTGTHYRSCMVATPGTPVSWLLVVSAVPADFIPVPSNHLDAPWRLVVHRDVNFDAGFPQVVKAAQDELVAAKDRIFIGAERFRPRSGTTLSELGAFVPVLSFAATSFPGAQASLKLPDDWASFTVRLLWANGGAGAGNVRWRVQRVFYRDGGDLSGSGADAVSDLVETAGAQSLLARSAATTALSHVDSGTASGRPDYMTLFIQRRSDDATDTLANAALLVGVELRKAS